jgi:hypothetical protein
VAVDIHPGRLSKPGDIIVFVHFAFPPVHKPLHNMKALVANKKYKSDVTGLKHT